MEDPKPLLDLEKEFDDPATHPSKFLILCDDAFIPPNCDTEGMKLIMNI